MADSWWSEGNTVALFELMQFAARDTNQVETFNSTMIGAARRMGISEEAIRSSFGSEESLVITQVSSLQDP